MKISFLGLPIASPVSHPGPQDSITMNCWGVGINSLHKMHNRQPLFNLAFAYWINRCLSMNCSINSYDFVLTWIVSDTNTTDISCIGVLPINITTKPRMKPLQYWWLLAEQTNGYVRDSRPLDSPYTLRWRHNECNGVSNHQPHDCLFNRLFGRRSK